MEKTKSGNSTQTQTKKSNQPLNKQSGSVLNKTASTSMAVKNNASTLNHDASTVNLVQNNVALTSSSGKTREDIKAEREAKKLAKQIAKNKSKDVKIDDASIETLKYLTAQPNVANKAFQTKSGISAAAENNEKTLPEKKPESERKKVITKLPSKNISKPDVNNRKSSTDEVDKAINSELSGKLENFHIHDADAKQSKAATTKAERRAIQEAQRLAKAKGSAEKTHIKKPILVEEKSDLAASKPLKLKGVSNRIEKLPDAHFGRHQEYKIKLFSHLNGTVKEHNLFINSTTIHPTVVQLGEQYSKRTVVGSNARCIAFLRAIKMVIQDYITPPKKEFARGLEASIKNCVDHLQECRPLAVSIINAHKYVKFILTQLPTNRTDSKLKEILSESLDNYIRDQIDKAAEAISSTVQEKISNGDVILTFGCSSLINHILEEAHRRKVDFRVILVDSRPFLEGQELLRRLVSKGISCTCVLINAVGFIMPEVTKVLLGAHALLANGYVMARTGTAQVALVARSFNVPVLVCCETHKFSERVQTDAIVFNELGSPDDLIIQSDMKENPLNNWQSFQKLYPLNLMYDITPPELVTAVVTEVAILPCTSVPVILRIKPTEI